MKKKLIFVFASVLLAAACSKYDDSALTGRVDRLESRVSSLEALCQQMNTNISSLQSLVSAVQNGDYITSVSPVTQGDRTIGYTIAFAKGPSITIYHGQDGEDGKNGANGKDGQPGAPGTSGQNGKDGHTPVIGVRQDGDGHYYWTLDGTWLTNGSGDKLKAEGKDGSDGEKGADGITPKLKIADGFWYVSYDGERSWTLLGKVGETTAGGDDSDSVVFFQSVDTSNPEYVVFKLTDGTEIKLPCQASLSISLNEEGLISMSPNSTRNIAYTIAGDTENVSIEVLSSGNVKAKISKSSETTGTLVIMTGATVDEFDRVVVVLSNGSKSITKSISFEKRGLVVTNGIAHTAPAEGGTVEIKIETSEEYMVSIPTGDRSWISYAGTRAWRSETLVLNIAANEGATRVSSIDICDQNGKSFQSFIVVQGGLSERTGAGDDPEEEEAEWEYLTTDQIPDPIFFQYLLDNYDRDKDNRISRTEAALVVNINVDGASAPVANKVRSLKGIKYFTNLRTLSCGSNSLTELDLSNNTALETLSCGSNSLTRLVVSRCTALTYLHCETNRLSSLDVSKNVALTELRCTGNQLSSLDVSYISGLQILVCEDNPLELLNLGDALLARLNDSQPGTSLIFKKLSSSTLKVISSKVTYVELRPTITYPQYLSSLDVRGCPALQTLICYNNQLTSLDLSNNRALVTLDCRNNQLTSLDVSKTSLGKNPLSRYDEPLKCNMETLETLYLLSGWEISGITYYRGGAISSKTQIAYVPAEEGSPEWMFPDHRFRVYIMDQFDMDKDGKISEEEAKKVTEIYLNSQNSGISTLEGIRFFTNLKKLSCGSLNLTSLDLSNNRALETLICTNNNQLTSLDLSNNRALVTLDCRNNQLTSLNLSNNPALQELNCSVNQLTSLNLSNNPALQELLCYNNQLTSLDLSNNPALTKLDCTPMDMLEKLYLKLGTKINGITVNRSTQYIPEHTQIVFLDEQGQVVG